MAKLRVRRLGKPPEQLLFVRKRGVYWFYWVVCCWGWLDWLRAVEAAMDDL